MHGGVFFNIFFPLEIDFLRKNNTGLSIRPLLHGVSMFVQRVIVVSLVLRPDLHGLVCLVVSKCK